MKGEGWTDRSRRQEYCAGQSRCWLPGAAVAAPGQAMGGMRRSETAASHVQRPEFNRRPARLPGVRIRSAPPVVRISPEKQQQT